MIKLINYKKSYGKNTILQVPDLLLNEGVYWIKGANGSGKSTLLKSMAGMLSCEGDILVKKDVSLKNQPVQYRKIVNFSEAEPLFPGFLTGSEMIDLFISAKSGSKSQRENFVESMKMQHYIETPIKSYSSGMLKKLSLLLAFLGRPKVVLLDEPLITIDSDSLKVLYNWISEAHNNEGVTFLITSHQLLDSDYLPQAKELLIEEQSLRSIN
jgi:ABC-2 type transport system ATP-binding protein